LHFAAGEQWDERVLLCLIGAGANVNATSLRGMTPLHAAVTKGRAGAVRLLLRHGADPYAQNFLGQSALRLGLAEGACAADVERAFVDAGYSRADLMTHDLDGAGLWFVSR
jgi:hypothetical protein